MSKSLKCKGQIYVEVGGDFTFLDNSGGTYGEKWQGGRYIPIHKVINYKDGYSDIVLGNGHVMPQVLLGEIGYVIGKPEIETVDSIKEM